MYKIYLQQYLTSDKNIHPNKSRFTFILSSHLFIYTYTLDTQQNIN